MQLRYWQLEHRFPNFYGLNLSWEIREGIKKHEAEYDRGNETLQRVVCDYIAGMTNRYAPQEHQKLFDPMERA